MYESTDWVDPFVFYKRASLSPIQVSEALADLAASGLVEADEAFRLFRLTKEGRAWVDQRNYDLFLKPRAAEWRSGPPAVYGPKPFYLPAPDELDLGFLTSLGLGGD